MAVIDNENWRDFFKEFMDLPELWKIKSSIYKNKFLKNKAYLKLLETYKKIDSNATINSMKNKIINLKTCYRRELKRLEQSEKSGAGSDEIYIPSLWYFHLLHFLKDHEITIAGTSSLDMEDDIEEIEELENEEQERQKVKRICPNKNVLKIQKEQFLEKAVEHLNEISKNKMCADDESDIFARAWAISFKKLSEDQKLYAKKAIDEILLLGHLNQLSLNIIPPISPVPRTSLGNGNTTFSSRSSTPINSESSTISIISDQNVNPNETILYRYENGSTNSSYPSLQDLLSDIQYS